MWWWSLVIASAGPGGAYAAEAALHPSGACRDGLANGAYELRMPDGRLRVAGAFRDGKRTGTFLFWSAAGARLAAIPYDDDLANGTIALWQGEGKNGAEPLRRLEAPVRAGALHGTRLSWHANGRPRSQALYEHGQLVEAKAWDAQGHELDEPAARRLVEQDARRDQGYIVRLERMVAEHRPRCD